MLLLKELVFSNFEVHINCFLVHLTHFAEKHLKKQCMLVMSIVLKSVRFIPVASIGMDQITQKVLKNTVVPRCSLLIRSGTLGSTEAHESPAMKHFLLRGSVVTHASLVSATSPEQAPSAATSKCDECRGVTATVAMICISLYELSAFLDSV